MLGAGDVLDEHAPIIAPNLTPDPDTGLGLWTDQQIVRAIREGVGRDGQRLRGDHPAAYYSVISDADVVAIVAYLRSLKPIVNKLPRSARQAMYSETVQPFVKPAASTDFKSERARGAYLAHIGECVGCHTPTTSSGSPNRALLFGGGRRFVDTGKGYGYEVSPDPAFGRASEPQLMTGERIVSSANITSDPSGISYYTPELFIQTIRSGKVGGVRRLSSAMPWIYLRRLTDADLRAIFAYLQTIAPVRHQLSNTDPARACPLCGRRHGLGETNVGVTP
jgi:mono/diheme cytochrome c family protein